MSLIQNYGEMAQAFAAGLDVDFQGARAALEAGIEDLARAVARAATMPHKAHALPDDVDAAHDAVTALRIKIGLPETPPPPPPPPGWEDITPRR
jgi:hypothetical protein